MANIIIADDQQHQRATLERIVTLLGHDVNTTRDGVQLSQAILKCGPFDLIISDDDMPGLTGSDLLVQLRREMRDQTPFILRSNAFGQELPNLCKRYGASFIGKMSEDDERLPELITQLLAKK